VGLQVTDALLRRGDRAVFHKLADNTGARFSEFGFATLVDHAAKDEDLAERVGLRIDVPLAPFRELLLRATEAVRSRLLALASPESRDRVQQVSAAISDHTQHEAGLQSERDYATAHARVLEMNKKGELTETAILGFAKADRYAEVLAALSVLCGAPMPLLETLLHSDHREAWLIPCKVARLDWSTVRAILGNCYIARPLPEQTLETARADYARLSQAGAARVLRFWQVRRAASKEAPPEESKRQPVAAGVAVPACM
jgi:uncharacterized protein (DUF2336 family)